MLNSLVNALNKNGAGVALPTDKVYSAADFANTYNALLAKNPTASAKTGIPPLPVPGNVAGPPGPDLTSSIPTSLDNTRTVGYEYDIQQQKQQQQEFDANEVPRQ